MGVGDGGAPGRHAHRADPRGGGPGEGAQAGREGG